MAEAARPALRKLLTGLRDEYWERHYTVRSAESKSPMALIGGSRVTEMLANVFYPWVILDQPEKWEGYRDLRSDLSSRRVEIAAARLLPGDPRAKELIARTAMQQGLLQIYEDFCMRDQSDCAACKFPRQLAQW